MWIVREFLLPALLFTLIIWIRHGHNNLCKQSQTFATLIYVASLRFSHEDISAGYNQVHSFERYMIGFLHC
jgi:hypothetical protein